MPRLFALFFGSIVRWGVTLLAGWLISRGIIQEHIGEELIYGLVIGVPPLAWSIWQKYKSRLTFLTALELPAKANEEDVKEVLRNSTQKEKLNFVAGKSVSQLLLIVCLMPALLLQGCPWGKNPQEVARSAEEQFAINTDRVTGYVNQALRVTESLVDNSLLTGAQGQVLVDKILNVNAVNKTLIITGQQFVIVQDGVRILRFTESDRFRLESLARGLREAIRNVAEDSNIPGIEPRARSQLTNLFSPMLALAERLINLTVTAKKITVLNGQYIEVGYGTRIANSTNHRARIEYVGSGD